jgi:hypothetical protein
MDEDTAPHFEHLILSGGMVYGYAFYGALQKLYRDGRWSYPSLRSIHANSVGSIAAILIVLTASAAAAAADTLGTSTNANTDPWEVMDAYLVDRPWQDVFPFSLTSLMNSYEHCGIFAPHCFQEIFRPLFAAHDISMETTLAEFYARYPVELYFMSVCFSLEQPVEGHLVELSHHTHPHWTVWEACYASCCAPVFFQPLMKDGGFYTDGCLMADYPVPQFLARYGHEPNIRERTLGIYAINPPPCPSTAQQLGSPTPFGRGQLPCCSPTPFGRGQLGSIPTEGSGSNNDGRAKLVRELPCCAPDLITYLTRIMLFLIHNSNNVIDRDRERERITEIQIDTTFYPFTDLYTFSRVRDDRRRMIDHGIATSLTL